MGILVALLSSGKGSWANINNLIKFGNWKKIILICNDFAFKNYNTNNNDKIKKIIFDEKDLEKSFEKVVQFFKEEIKDFEVEVNLISGTGLEHMFLLNSLLKAGLGINFVYIDGKSIKFLNVLNKPKGFEEDSEL